MSTISAADVNKLRQMTGAGMMDCKKPLPKPMAISKLQLISYVKKALKLAQHVPTEKLKKVRL